MGGSLTTVDDLDGEDRPEFLPRATAQRYKATGKPTIISEAKANMLLNAVSKGLRYDDAALLAGINRDTFLKWRRHARNGVAPYSELLADMDAAEQAGKMAMLDTVVSIARGEVPEIIEMTRVTEDRQITTKRSPEWRAAAWILERRYRDEFGKDEPGDKGMTLQVSEGITLDVTRPHARLPEDLVEVEGEQADGSSHNGNGHGNNGLNGHSSNGHSTNGANGHNGNGHSG